MNEIELHCLWNIFSAGDSSEKEEDGEEPESDEQNLKNLAKDCINGFDFEEAVKSVDEFKPLVCHSHGEVDYKKVFLDVVSLMKQLPYNKSPLEQTLDFMHEFSNTSHSDPSLWWISDK